MTSARSEQLNTGNVLREHRNRIRALEAKPAGTGGGAPVDDGPWIYVGTTGVDGVDGLLTADSPPFTNSWTNAGSPYAPVSFLKTGNGWVHLRGAFIGGADGTSVFTLPVGYRPAYQQEMILPISDGFDFATIRINTDGTVYFITRF